MRPPFRNASSPCYDEASTISAIAYHRGVLYGRPLEVMALVSAESRSRGRPRDPRIEDRVLDAAITLYAESGWIGFTFEGIARRTGVGKASLYARWPNRAALLHHTLESRWIAVEKVHTGTLEGDLTALARMIFESLTSTNGGVARWIAIDALHHPEVVAATGPFREEAVKQGRTIARRAINRGELNPSVNPGLLMDLLVGAVRNHVGNTPPHLQREMIAKKDTFVKMLVKAVMLGVEARPPLPQAEDPSLGS